MTFFNEVFLICLLVGALGGFVHALVRIVRKLDKDELNSSKVVGWLTIYPAIGAALGFIAWLLSLLMVGDAGVYLAAFIGGLGGIPALEAILRSNGIAIERDMLAKSRKRDTDLLTPLKKRLEEMQAKLDLKDQQLSEARARLQVATERDELRNEIQDLLEERKARLSGSTQPSKKQEPQSKADDDVDPGSKRTGN